MQERELTLKDFEKAAEEVFKDSNIKTEMFSGNLIRVYANGETWDLIMDKDAYEAEMEFVIRKDRELHNNMIDFFEEIYSYKNKEDE